MLGGSRLLEVGSAALDVPGADGVEVTISRTDSALTRFAGSRIHQSTARVDAEIRIRVVLSEGRVGVAVTNDLDPRAVRRTAQRAAEAARLVPADPGFPGLAPGGQAYAAAMAPDEETVGCAPSRRAELVAAVLAELPAGTEAAGTVETGVRERAVLTSTGIAVSAAASSAGLTVLVSGAGGPTGWAEGGGTAVGRLDASALARRAVGKLALAGTPVALPPGRYPVVLEPGASAVLLQWLGWLALPGRALAEERSALCGRIGTQVCSPLVTIVDDPLAPDLPGTPFDAEGTATRRVPFVEDGVAVGVAHDRRTAAAAGTTSTGHALPAPNSLGGVPGHLVLEPGAASLDELFAGLDRGLYVTRFHYTNVVHPVTTSITGMTRDGTFLVEDGRIVGGVHDLRFTQSVLDALAGVEAVGRDAEVATDLFYGSSSAPALRLRGFTFTSATAP